MEVGAGRVDAELYAQALARKQFFLEFLFNYRLGDTAGEQLINRLLSRSIF